MRMFLLGESGAQSRWTEVVLTPIAVITMVLVPSLPPTAKLLLEAILTAEVLTKCGAYLAGGGRGRQQ